MSKWSWGECGARTRAEETNSSEPDHVHGFVGHVRVWAREAWEREGERWSRVEDDCIRHRVAKMERKQKVQVRNLCGDNERRSWTSVHDQLDEEKFWRWTKESKNWRGKGRNRQPIATNGDSFKHEVLGWGGEVKVWEAGREEAMVTWGQHGNKPLVTMTGRKGWTLEELQKSWPAAMTGWIKRCGKGTEDVTSAGEELEYEECEKLPVQSSPCWWWTGSRRRVRCGKGHMLFSEKCWWCRGCWTRS